MIGVTTTLAREKMQGEGPDAMRPDIGHISVEALMSLKRAQAQTVEDSGSVHQDRLESNKQASTSQNVSS